MCLAHLFQKATHTFSIHLFPGYVINISIPRTYRCILILKLSHQSKINNWSVGRWRPEGTRVAHPTKAGLILKHKANREVVLIFYAGGNHKLREIFLNSSCADWSLLGCFVS